MVITAQSKPWRGFTSSQAAASIRLQVCDRKDWGQALSSALLGAEAPVVSFSDLGLPKALVEILARRGIASPLPIQAATIADALAGRDVLGKAPTGSGKTLAFALPLAAMLRRGAPRRPSALVLAPTRELAGQIADEMGPLLAARGLKAYPFFGGVGFGGQRSALHRGVDVVVACPGRLEDLMRSRDVDLSTVEAVVVDEADRMADMGFLNAVCRILDATPKDRQTLLFSATLDREVDVLVRRYQVSPVRHEVVVDEGDSRATHEFRAVATAERAALCAEIVKASSSSVVFVRTKHGADRVAQSLRTAGTSAAAIHGNRSQAQREQALEAFRAGKVRALVATDVAARGIHVDKVECVVHYDLPADAKDYVHRSGRTARAGEGGTVISLVTPEQRVLAASLQRHLDYVIEGAGLVAGEVAEAGAAGLAGRRRAGAGTSGVAAVRGAGSRSGRARGRWDPRGGR